MKECKLCNSQNEDALHAIFHYLHAHATWFSSQLGLKITSILQDDFKSALFVLWHGVDDEQIATFMLTAWNIWKARCHYVFQEKPCIAHETIRAVHSQAWAQWLGALLHLSSYKANSQPQLAARDIVTSEYMMRVDGSFNAQEKGRAACILHQRGTLIRYDLLGYREGISPFHMEVRVFLMAVSMAVKMNLDECLFLSDSKLLVDSLAPERRYKPLQAVDWQSYNQLINMCTC